MWILLMVTGNFFFNVAEMDKFLEKHHNVQNRQNMNQKTGMNHPVMIF